MLTGSYRTLVDRLAATIPRNRLITDDLRRIAFGRDASFYSLVPRLVVSLQNETDVVALLREARALSLPVTFRAAGTSLSGQAVTDSILALLGPTWNGYKILDGGGRIALQPGVIGSNANFYLAPHGRKIGPDPASINSAMIGGIAANNASGMCCGTSQNSYRTLASMRIIFADGSTLDTGNPSARRQFQESHPDLINRISDLSRRVKANAPLADRIRRKFSMKNTTGYSLNALVDFDDPFEILQHLMIGSEGTLGFIAEITLATVPEYAHKASALMMFPDIGTACRAVTLLKQERVEAVELMDRASLRSVEGKKGMPDSLRLLDAQAAALLVETRAPDPATLPEHIERIVKSIDPVQKLRQVEFTSDPAEYAQLWDIRKGLFPSVGAMRQTGTTVIIEDVAFPVPQLADAALDLRELFTRHRYHDAIIFGHALEGNLHFVFAQDFNTQKEVDRYGVFIDDVTKLVVSKYDGSLKAEHGTGRNMAPFVELEWGREAYELMREIKLILDPGNLLNPGVILNDDSRIHLRNLKLLPEADPLVDKCIECGFCEVHCPSKNLTLTPRQRIAVYREIRRLGETEGGTDRSRDLARQFDYFGNQTCATDGLCATSCPVGIDTGKLIKQLRMQSHSRFADGVAGLLAHNMRLTTAAMRQLLNVVNVAHVIAGTSFMSAASRALRRATGNHLPLWNPAMPKGGDRLPRTVARQGAMPAVVYIPSCINRTMGIARGARSRDSLPTIVVRLLERAGFAVVYPDRVKDLCCGMAFASKGFEDQGKMKAAEMEAAVVAASENGRLPILMDMSPCLLRMKESMTAPLEILEPVEFTLRHLTGRLTFRKSRETVTIHSTCSARKMGLTEEFLALARRCSDEVVVPEEIECCGWAGDRGFTYPELNASALEGLRAKIPGSCSSGYSTSRTCEIGLTLHGGIEYRSILYLVEECTRR